MDIKNLEFLQKELDNSLSLPENFKQSIELSLKLHSLLHLSEMSGIKSLTCEDELWDGLTEAMFRDKPTKRDATIAWCIWHITRIEDITTNILIANQNQIFNSNNWQVRLNTKIIDTGNVMTDDEIIAFSNDINIQELKKYRIAVGRNTQEIIKRLSPTDLKSKADKKSLQRILSEGAVLDVDGAKWLIGFWGGKTIAGLLKVPVTRHLIMHLKESRRIKEKILKKDK